jgi:hypothetical protein
MNRRLFLVTCSSSVLRAFQRKNPKPKQEPLWKWILRVTGISATSRGLKGSLESPRGDVWIMASDGINKTQQRLTFDGEYHSPVFAPDDRRVLALRRQGFIWISPQNGESEPLAFELAGVLRLVGFENEAAGGKPRVVAITRTSIGLFSPWDGKFEPFPAADIDEETRQQLLRGQIQFGDVLLQVGGDGHELTSQKDNRAPVVLTSSPKVIYADPALSHDGRRLVFIRADVAAR